MARSTYIYLLAHCDAVGSGVPIAACTVKRELTDVMSRMPDLSDTEVWRLEDGIPWVPGGRAYLGTGAEFLAKERPS